MQIGIVGTGAIANLHARAYKNIGFTVRACTSNTREKGQAFAEAHGTVYVSTLDELCQIPEIDIIDVCTFPDFRLQPVEMCARYGKHIQVQKPMATNLEAARRMIETAAKAGIKLGVVSQHRFDDASRFLIKAIHDGRLGKLLQLDAYVKWFRTAQYYARPIKGSWHTEGGGALMNQAIHQVDLLRWFGGPLTEVFAMWNIGALHKMESEDMVSAVIRYANGAIGVIQAATAFAPGYPERVEIHGTKGSAIITGDKLTTWDVSNDEGEPAPIATQSASGASDPMAISLEPFERQFTDFAESIRTGRQPLIGGEEGYQALEVVDAVYRSCRTGDKIKL